MKNVKPSRIQTCITLKNREFEKVVKQIWGEAYVPEYFGDRVQIVSIRRDVPKGEMMERLKEYFDVDIVTAVFFRSDTSRCVWIAYMR